MTTKPKPIPTELSTTYRDFNELHAEALDPRTAKERRGEVLDHMEAIAAAARRKWAS